MFFINYPRTVPPCDHITSDIYTCIIYCMYGFGLIPGIRLRKLIKKDGNHMPILNGWPQDAMISFRSFCTMLIISYTKIKFIFVWRVSSQLFWYNLNHLDIEVKSTDSFSNTLIYWWHIYSQEKDGEMGNKFSFRYSMVATIL